MKNDFQTAKTCNSPSYNLRCLFSLLPDMLWQFIFQAVYVQRICPSLLCCAVIVIDLKKKTYFWSRRGEIDKQRHSPQSSLSIINYEGFPNLWYFWRLASLGFLLFFFFFYWHNSWFWTEGWRRRPAISLSERHRNPKWKSRARHVCLMALAKVNQAHGLQYMKEGRRDPHSHQTRMNNSASVSKFWKEMTCIYYSVSLDRITSQPSQ